MPTRKTTEASATRGFVAEVRDQIEIDLRMIFLKIDELERKIETLSHRIDAFQSAMNARFAHMDLRRTAK